MPPTPPAAEDPTVSLSLPRWLGPMLLVLVGALSWAWAWSVALIEKQTLSEARTVADLAENVGRWASQYGGVHVKTVGVQAKIPGNFLTRTSYSLNADEVAMLAAASKPDARKLETYHWKNPALVQREMADVVAASGSKASFRLTAATVLNPNNAPNDFERRALDALKGAATSGKDAGEYWEVQGRRMLFGRAVVAQESCLRCHDKAETAPEFLRTNASFNGGGGFGYVAGQPAGLISVSLPLGEPLAGLRKHVPLPAWIGLGLALIGLGWGGWQAWQWRQAPRRRQRR